MATQPIYQFYACLRDYKPRIWRRFQVAGNITFARLGYIVMTLFEMKAQHLFCITYPLAENVLPEKDQNNPEELKIVHDMGDVRRFEVIDSESFPGEEHESVFDATTMTVRRFTNKPGMLLNFEYDYGDGWEVALTLENIIWDQDLPGKLLPRVLEGYGYGIIEDCGGPAGLKNLEQAFQQKSGTDYESLSKWLGCNDLDLSTFDLEDMNFRLKKIPRIYRDLYEYDYAPTKQSLNLLDRNYKR